MAKIRPMTPEHVVSADLQGGPKSAFVWEPDGLGYGKPRALTENSSVAVDGSVFTRDVPTSSLRTEPDIDTILPLPGAGQMVNVVSPVSSEEVHYCVFVCIIVM